MEQVLKGRELYRALSDLARRYQFRSKNEICCYGLTVSQCYALEALNEREKVTSTELAAYLNLDLSSTSRIVDELVRKKLARRTRSSGDSRVKEVQIELPGRKLIERIESDFAAILEATLRDYPPAVQKLIPDVLRRFARVLDVNGCAPVTETRKAG